MFTVDWLLTVAECRKQLSISTFITRKKPQQTLTDNVRKKKQKQFSSPQLSMLAVIHQVYEVEVVHSSGQGAVTCDLKGEICQVWYEPS